MTKTNQVYFNYDVSSFLNYTIHKAKGVREKAETMFDMSEMIFDAVICGEAPDVYDIDGKLKEANAYLSKKLKNTLKSQNKIKLDDYQDDVKNDIIRASARSWEASYQNEWLKKCYALLVKSITKSAQNATGEDNPTIELLTEDKKWVSLPVEMTADIWGAKSVRIHTTAERVNELNDLSGQFDDVQDLANELTAYQSGALEPESITSNEYEGIDYYGTLGDDNDWLEEYKEDEETSAQIEKDIADEKAKHGNAEYINAQLATHTAQIREVLATYSTDSQYTEQILRAVGSIEATAKRATLK